MNRITAFFLLLTLCSASAIAQDISNPRALIFVGDQSENLIDVISVNSSEVVYRIETSIRPDHILATPFAPILIYSDIQAKKLVFYDLQNKRESKTIDLPFVPLHMVLDTSGSKIGISNDVEGGFALVYPFDQRIEFSLSDFPPSPAVLFDPNEVDIYYSNGTAGTIGILNTNTEERYEIPVTDEPGQVLTAPSRSLDGRYIYIGNVTSGEVYSLNAYSGAIFKTFDVGGALARPYTTPEGVFLYMMDQENGRMITIEQHGFTQYADVSFGQGIDLVTVGRFDHLNLFTSSENNQWSIYDNIKKSVTKQGEFSGQPIGALGSADGKLAYVALQGSAEIAVVNLEKGSVDYIPATNNGSGAFTLGLSNNVCH
jgi:DNA-binding beta-propeller fold protein YncE